MAFADLSFTAALWRGRGLCWLTAGADLPPGLSLTAEAPASAAAPSPAARSGRPASPPASRAVRPSRPAAREEQARERAAPQAGAPAGTSPRWRPLAPEALPQGWQNRLAATRPGLVAWTYWNLAQDLSATGGSAPGEDAGAEARALRRSFLGRLVRELAHPAGTHTFWPACMPQAQGAPVPEAGPDFAAHPEAFWSGAAHLGCRAVIVMGSAAVRALGLPGNALPLSQLRWRGQHVLVLWEVDTLAQDAARFGPTLAVRRQALGPVTAPRR